MAVTKKRHTHTHTQTVTPVHIKLFSAITRDLI